MFLEAKKGGALGRARLGFRSPFEGL